MNHFTVLRDGTIRLMDPGVSPFPSSVIGTPYLKSLGISPSVYDGTIRLTDTGISPFASAVIGTPYLTSLGMSRSIYDGTVRLTDAGISPFASSVLRTPYLKSLCISPSVYDGTVGLTDVGISPFTPSVIDKPHLKSLDTSPPGYDGVLRLTDTGSAVRSAYKLSPFDHTLPRTLEAQSDLLLRDLLATFETFVATAAPATESSTCEIGELEGQLARIAPRFAEQWRGALFALMSVGKNPEAARHFCTSCRELFSELLRSFAPDAAVREWHPKCDTHHGKPTRRARLEFILFRSDHWDATDDQVRSILALFEGLNGGTHGFSSNYTSEKLQALRGQIEQGLSQLVRMIRRQS